MEVNSTSSSSPSASSTAPTTSSPGRSAITSTASSRPGHSGATRLTVPSRVASASPVEPGSYVVSASTRSPRSSADELGGRRPAAQRQRAGRHAGHRRQVEHADPQDPPGRLVTSPTWPRAVVRTRLTIDVVPVPLGARPALLSTHGGPGQQAGRRQQHVDRVVGHLERRRTGRHQRLEVAADEHRPPGACRARAATSASSSAITPRSTAGSARIPSSVAIVARSSASSARSFSHLQRDQPAQLHVQDVRRLQLGEPDLRLQLGPRLGGVLRRADDPDDLVDRVERDEQALDQVRPLLRLAQPEAGPPGDHVDPVVEEDLQQVLEPERAGLARRPGRRC